MRSANSGLWRSVTGRGSNPTGSVTGCAARHEARHSPRLRLAPPCSEPRPRPGVAELGVVRRRYPSPIMAIKKQKPNGDAVRKFQGNLTWIYTTGEDAGLYDRFEVLRAIYRDGRELVLD